VNNDYLDLPSAALGEDPIRLVYILGVVRSGSTLSDTMLGNHPEMLSVGELCNVCENGWTDQRRCACGELGPKCPFWTDVRHAWARRTGTDDEQGYGQLVRALEKHRLWLPRLAAEARQQSPRFAEYAWRTLTLYQALRQVSGKSVLVDSSKRASRLLLLSHIPGIDLRVVHLVRDVRGVTWSEKKTKTYKQDGTDKVRHEPSKPSWRTALLWTAVNRQSDWMRRRLPEGKSIRVRYEDLVTQPEAELARIGALAEADLSGLVADVTADRPLAIAHTIAGNAMRMKGPVRLRPDVEWMEKLPERDRRTCWLIAGRLMRRYGYQRQGEPLALPAPADTPVAERLLETDLPKRIAA